MSTVERLSRATSRRKFFDLHKLFKEKQYKEALRLYEEAMQMKPNDDEARAAQYNAACVHVQQKQWQKAVDCIKEAVNVYGLKASVVMSVWFHAF